MRLLEKVRDFKNKIECKNLTDKFFAELHFRKSVNIQVTLHTLANYLVADQLERTGILYSPYDKYIQTEAQRLFWEWKREGVINEFEDFNDTTKNWICKYV